MLAPRLVCVSFSEPPHLLNRPDGLDRVAQLLADPDVRLVGHNVAYDLGVIAAEDPARFLPLIFAALDADRITDTKIREQLAQLAIGQLRMNQHGRTRYDLGALTMRHNCGLTTAYPLTNTPTPRDNTPLMTRSRRCAFINRRVITMTSTTRPARHGHCI